MARFTPTDIVSQYSAIAALNANFDTVATLIELCLFRDGTSPNQMLTNINMNNFKVQNLADGTASSDAVNKGQLDDLLTDVEASEAAAAASASAAATSATDAATSASAAAASAASIVHASGTYTPVSSDLSGLSSVTGLVGQYSRIGNIVTVSVFGTYDGGTNGVQASFRLTLPIASGFGAITDLAGPVSTQTGDSALAVAEPVNNKAEIFWVPSIPGGGWFTTTFQYRVI